ncbi:MAG: FkbM family methyltransferase [Candidatus Thiodiazotropha sp. (ex Monitilora ramsayi)]|nr:FkbM family methyltransferase [Candidatus Thiodiazotropha sp. (ex Monitilora ramsayi)]
MFKPIKTYLRTVGLRGSYYALLGTIKKKMFDYKISQPGIRHPFYLRLPSSDAPTYRQVFQQNEYEFTIEAQPKIIVDAGANIGLASIYFANKYPEAKIFSIEPEQSNFNALKKNTASYPNITVIHAALWHENRKINLVDPGLGNWGFMTQEEGKSGSLTSEEKHQVQAITVNDILNDYDVNHIDILKIDIEGAEREVFLDTSSWLEKVGMIIIELHDRMKPGCNRSFYNGSNGFDYEWSQGENVYLSRQELKRR